MREEGSHRGFTSVFSCHFCVSASYTTFMGAFNGATEQNRFLVFFSSHYLDCFVFLNIIELLAYIFPGNVLQRNLTGIVNYFSFAENHSIVYEEITFEKY